MRPVSGNRDDDSSDGLGHLAGYLDQHRSPGIDLSLAQGIFLPTTILVATTFCTSQYFHRQRGVFDGDTFMIRIVRIPRPQRRRIRDHGTQLNEEIQSCYVKLQAEVVGNEAMTTEPIAREAVLEFFVTVFALPPFGIMVIASLRKNGRALAIGDDEPAVGAYAITLGLGDHPPGVLPRSCPVQELIEQASRFVGFLKLLDSLL